MATFRDVLVAVSRLASGTMLEHLLAGLLAGSNSGVSADVTTQVALAEAFQIPLEATITTPEAEATTLYETHTSDAVSEDLTT